jgi:DNA-binding transcriptional LysR family regulator
MSSPEAIKRLTETGLGASILPARMVSRELQRGTLKVVRTGRVTFQRLLGVVYRDRATLSQPATVFLKMLLERHRLRRAP